MRCDKDCVVERTDTAICYNETQEKHNLNTAEQFPFYLSYKLSTIGLTG